MYMYICVLQIRDGRFCILHNVHASIMLVTSEVVWAMVVVRLTLAGGDFWASAVASAVCCLVFSSCSPPRSSWPSWRSKQDIQCSERGREERKGEREREREREEGEKTEHSMWLATIYIVTPYNVYIHVHVSVQCTCTPEKIPLTKQICHANTMGTITQWLNYLIW